MYKGEYYGVPVAIKKLTKVALLDYEKKVRATKSLFHHR